MCEGGRGKLRGLLNMVYVQYSTVHTYIHWPLWQDCYNLCCVWSGSCIPLAIFRAAVEDDVESLKAWQVAGADLNMEDYHRCTPLDMVCIPVCVRACVLQYVYKCAV